MHAVAFRTALDALLLALAVLHLTRSLEGRRMRLSSQLVSLTAENVLAQLGRIFIEFVTIRADVGLGWNVGTGSEVIRQGLFAAYGVSFDHVHLIERLGGESLRAVIALVLEFDERVHFLMGLFEGTLKNDVVTEIDATRRTREALGLDVLLFDVLL